MAKTVFDVLKINIEAEIASALEFLENGGAKDYAQYKEVTGLIRGLKSSISHIQDLSRNYMEDDDDE
jgi:hypothetical protein